MKDQRDEQFHKEADEAVRILDQEMAAAKDAIELAKAKYCRTIIALQRRLYPELGY
jgi:hypothetical protein